MEDIRIVFSNIMEKLLKQAHKNKNVLEYKEINDAFKNIELTPEKFEWILDYFEKQGVDVLNTNEEDDGDDNFIYDDTEEVEIIDDADILEGVSLEDPVRMYLKRLVIFLCLQQKRKYFWHSVSKREMSRRESSLLRQTSDL